jgi:hypothetical protein
MAAFKRSWRKLHYTTLKIEPGGEAFIKWQAAPEVLIQVATPKDGFYEMNFSKSEFEQEIASMSGLITMWPLH